jgi:putative spermidine/putrescine transport system substrate-binding protein
MNKPFRTALVAVSLLGCQPGAARAADSCTSMQVYLNIGPHLREDVLAYIAPKLKQTMNVDIVAEEMGSAQMLQRVTAQGANPRVTLMEMDTAVAADTCANQKICAAIDLAKIPNAANLADWGISRDERGQVYAINVEATAIGLIYNEQEFAKRSLKPPTSWTDLARADLKGHVTITSPASTWGLMELVMFARLKGGGESNIDPGFAMVAALQPNLLQVHTWSSEAANLFQLGGAWIGASGATLAASLRAKGVPVRWVAPAEGAPLSSAGLEIVANSPCQDVAHAFISAFTSAEFGVIRMKNAGALSPAKGVWQEASPELQANMDVQPADFGRYVTLDWTVINKQRAAWVSRWQRDMN